MLRPGQAGQDRAIRLAHLPFHSLCPSCSLRAAVIATSMAGTAVRAGLISEQPARIEDDNRGFAALSRSRAALDS